MYFTHYNTSKILWPRCGQLQGYEAFKGPAKKLSVQYSTTQYSTMRHRSVAPVAQYTQSSRNHLPFKLPCANGGREKREKGNNGDKLPNVGNKAKRVAVPCAWALVDCPSHNGPTICMLAPDSRSPEMPWEAKRWLGRSYRPLLDLASRNMSHSVDLICIAESHYVSLLCPSVSFYCCRRRCRRFLIPVSLSLLKDWSST